MDFDHCCLGKKSNNGYVHDFFCFIQCGIKEFVHDLCG